MTSKDRAQIREDMMEMAKSTGVGVKYERDAIALALLADIACSLACLAWHAEND